MIHISSSLASSIIGKSLLNLLLNYFYFCSLNFIILLKNSYSYSSDFSFWDYSYISNYISSSISASRSSFDFTYIFLIFSCLIWFILSFLGRSEKARTPTNAVHDKLKLLAVFKRNSDRNLKVKNPKLIV